jgi:hypothetical protein
MPLELALEFVQEVQTMFSLYWRLPSLAPGKLIRTERDPNGVHLRTSVQVFDGVWVHIQTPERFSFMRDARDLRTELDDYYMYEVVVETAEGPLTSAEIAEIFPLEEYERSGAVAKLTTNRLEEMIRQLVSNY